MPTQCRRFSPSSSAAQGEHHRPSRREPRRFRARIRLERKSRRRDCGPHRHERPWRRVHLCRKSVVREDDAKAVYLLPVDAKLEELDKTGYALQELYDNLGKTGARTTMLVTPRRLWRPRRRHRSPDAVPCPSRRPAAGSWRSRLRAQASHSSKVTSYLPMASGVGTVTSCCGSSLSCRPFSPLPEPSDRDHRTIQDPEARRRSPWRRARD